MIVKFKEKFKGNNRLIRVSEISTAVPVVLLWFFVLREQIHKISEQLIQTDNAFYEAILEVPIEVGYLLFYWSVISWIVYYALKWRYSAPEGK